MRCNSRCPCGVSANPVLPPTPFQMGLIVSVIIFALTVMLLSVCWEFAEREMRTIIKVVMVFVGSRRGVFGNKVSGYVFSFRNLNFIFGRIQVIVSCFMLDVRYAFKY